MTIHHTAIRAIALALCTFAPACDPTPPTVDFRYIPPQASNYWTDGDKGCDGGLFLKTEQGTMCLPPCGDSACGHHQADSCGHTHGGESICAVDDHCVYACLGDADCIAGQRCSSAGFCVWENAPAEKPIAVAKQLWSVCDAGEAECANGDGICRQTEAGRICAPKCANLNDCNAPGGLMNECSEGAPAACVEGSCQTPCSWNGDCWGVDGMVCDIDAGECVWPWTLNPAPPPEPVYGCGIGEMFGACDLNTPCADGLTCMMFFDGTQDFGVCSPSCATCDADPAATICGAQIGTPTPTCDVSGICKIACDEPWDCVGGAVCISGMCAWPF